MQEPSSYTVRPMEPGDVPAVVAIDRLSFPTPWPAASYLYELGHRGQSFFYVLLKPSTEEDAVPGRGWRRWLRSVTGTLGGSRVIGYMGFRLRDPGAHLSTVAVHPAWQGRGLGELLLLYALERVLELGLRAMTLEVRPTNHVAQRLYEKYGFRHIGIHHGYYRDGEDAWLMRVDISPETYGAQLTKSRQALEARLGRQRTEVGQNGWDTI